MSNKIAKRTKATIPQTPANSSTQPVVSASHLQHTFSGPVPPPDLLSGYDDIIPGAAERILRMAEEDAAHRREIEKAAIDHNSAEVKRGQNYGLIVSLTAFSVCAFSAYIGDTTTASVIGGTAVVGLATAFITGRNK